MFMGKPEKLQAMQALGASMQRAAQPLTPGGSDELAMDFSILSE